MKWSKKTIWIGSAAVSLAVMGVVIEEGTQIFAEESVVEETDTNKTYTISSGYTMQGIYASNKEEMDEATNWDFERRLVYVGTYNPNDESFTVPSHVESLQGYGTVDQGTTLMPYYYNYDNHDVIFQEGAQATVDNFYFAKDYSYGAVNVVVGADAQVTFSNCVFEGKVTLGKGALVTFKDCVLYGAIEANDAKTVLENTSFNDVLTIDSNELDPITYKEAYSNDFGLPNEIDGYELSDYAVQTNVAGLEVDGSRVTGAPEEVKEGIVFVSGTYRQGQDGFNFVVPYYVTVQKSQALEVMGSDISKVYDGLALVASAQVNVDDGTTLYYSTQKDASGQWTSWSLDVPSIIEVGTLEYGVWAMNTNYVDAYGQGSLTIVPVQDKPIIQEVEDKKEEVQKEVQEEAKEEKRAETLEGEVKENEEKFETEEETKEQEKKENEEKKEQAEKTDVVEAASEVPTSVETAAYSSFTMMVSSLGVILGFRKCKK